MKPKTKTRGVEQDGSINESMWCSVLCVFTVDVVEEEEPSHSCQWNSVYLLITL